MSARFILSSLFLGLLFFPQTSSARADIDDCSSRDGKDIRAVMWNIADDWENFEDDVEDYSGREVDTRIFDEMDSGSVTCEYNPGILHPCRVLGEAGIVNVFSDEVILCESFLDFIEDESQKDRRACYAGILTQHFAGGDLHLSPALLGRAAVEYWNDRFGSDMDYDSCGL